MAKTNKVGDLQINEDIKFQERTWVIQRAGWMIFALINILAILGLFGDGVLSDAQAGQEGEALWLEYPRFERFENEFRITVHANPGAATQDEIKIQLNQNYLANVQVTSIAPTPDSQIKQEDWITYVFRRNGNAPFTAYFYITPLEAGSLSGTFQLESENPVTFSQFIYP